MTDFIPNPSTRESLTSENPWIDGVRPNPQGKARLFCFPYAGGAASAYRNWVSCLPEFIELCPIQLPGRERRYEEPPLESVSAMVEGIGEGIAPVLDKPFYLFGHSMGGILAFEFARYLRRKEGPKPLGLFVSGAKAPQDCLPPRDPKHALSKDRLLQEIVRLGGMTPEVLEHPELVDLFLSTLRADLKAVETYRYELETPLEVPLMVFGGEKDPEASPEQLSGWKSQTRFDFSCRIFPGNHFFIHSKFPEVLSVIQDQFFDEVLKKR